MHSLLNHRLNQCLFGGDGGEDFISFASAKKCAWKVESLISVARNQTIIGHLSRNVHCANQPVLGQQAKAVYHNALRAGNATCSATLL